MWRRCPTRALFNEYFGSGLSSIVFQEIREAKALAYGASASYTVPGEGGGPLRARVHRHPGG
jgi:predicted Zn-dependent peptidase